MVGRVVLLEKDVYPREKICAGAVGARAERALASIGVVVEAPSVEIAGITIRTRNAARSERSRSSRIGRVVRRREFDAALMMRAKQQGLVVQAGAGVRAVHRIAEGVRVDSAAGSLSARVVVGADGVGSVVRRFLGLGHTRYRAQALEIDTPATRGDAARDLLHFDVSNRRFPGYYWDFPTVIDGQAMWSRGVYLLKRADQGAPDVVLHEVLDEALRARGLRLTDFRQKRFAERGFEPHRPAAAARVLLVGEAAGIDPITGEGIAQAVLYGKLAGEYIAEKLRGNDLAFRDWASAFTAARVGGELRARERAVDLFYGALRPWMESILTDNPYALRLAMQHFAGESLATRDAVRAGTRLLTQPLRTLICSR